MSQRKRRDPQEDKILSYQRDGRNTYGESPHGARKSIRFRKAWVNRSYRQQVHQELHPNRDPDETTDRVANVQRKRWKKLADSPLGEVVQWRQDRRAKAAGGQVPELSEAQLEA